MSEPARQDTSLPFWTIDQAARHFGFTRNAIVKYIRGGLPTYHNGLTVKPHEVIAEWMRRKERKQRATGQ